jgi:Fe2+ or Zn2+ uptake regulation protein
VSVDEAQQGEIKASVSLFEEFYRNFQKHSKRIGLKDSLRKEVLVKTLFFASKYLSAEEIAHDIRLKYHVKISLPLVYKILYTLESIHIVTVFLTYPSKTKKVQANLHVAL